MVVSWTKDRARFKKVLPELPVFRWIRRGGIWFLAITLLLEVLLIIGEPTATTVILGLFPSALGVTAYFSCLRAALAEVRTGALTWRFDDRGLRVEGDTATEIPWSQMAKWRRAADHLIIEVRATNPRKPNPALAAPLEAIDPAWDRIEPRLRENLGRDC